MGNIVIDEVSVQRRAGTEYYPEFHWTLTSVPSGNDPRYGQLACGSYGVAPAVGDTGVQLVSVTGKTSGNAAILNLMSGPIQRLSHAATDNMASGYGRLDASKQLIDSLPLTVTPASGQYESLVCVKVRDHSETPDNGTAANGTSQIDCVNFLSIFSDVPAAGWANTLRPSPWSNDKSAIFSLSDFDLTRIPQTTLYELTPSVNSIRDQWRFSTDCFAKAVWEVSEADENVAGEAGRALRCFAVTEDYGATFNRDLCEDILALLTDNETIANKTQAIASIISHGLDSWFAVHHVDDDGDHSMYSSGAGQWLGGITSEAFAMSLMEDSSGSEYIQTTKNVAIQTLDNLNLAEFSGPQELRQIRRGLTGQLLWADRTGESGYWSGLLGGCSYDACQYDPIDLGNNPSELDPYKYIDGSCERPGKNYYSAYYGGAMNMAAIAVVMPEYRAVLNTSAPLEFAHRVFNHGLWTSPDPVAPPAFVDQFGSGSTCDPSASGAGCTRYGQPDPTGINDSGWGPNPDIEGTYAIEHNRNGVGRFVSLHGTSIDPRTDAIAPSLNPSNTSIFETIIAQYDGVTYLDWDTDLQTATPTDLVRWKDLDTGQNYFTAKNADPNCIIKYTIDGSEPTYSSPTYSAPVAVGVSDVIRVRGYLNGKTPSKITRLTTSIEVEQTARSRTTFTIDLI